VKAIASMLRAVLGSADGVSRLLGQIQAITLQRNIKHGDATSRLALDRPQISADPQESLAGLCRDRKSQFATCWRMIPKSGNRFSEKIMLKNEESGP